MRATRSVCRCDVMPLDGNLEVLAAVEEVVDRVIAVAARDDRGARAELVQPLRLLAAWRVNAGERLGLEQIRRHDGRERK